MLRPVVVGLSYRSASVAVRERLTPRQDEMSGVLTRLHEEASEVALIVTCNRIEVCAILPSDADPRGLASALAEMRGVDPEETRRHVYVHEDQDAVRHLFYVAAGLDSMVLGESEVLGQVARAQRAARESGTLGAGLDRLFSHAVRVGRRARSETGISRHSVSVSSVAVRLALETFGALDDRNVLVVGAGEAARLACRALKSAGAGELVIVNRTMSHAQALADEVGAKTLPFDALEDALGSADIVVAASSGSGFLIGPSALDHRANPLLVLDVAVPRDVDPAVRDIPGVILHDIDDLQTACAEGWRERAEEVALVEAIVAQEVLRFMVWWEQREATPVISALYQEAEALRRRELDKALRLLGSLSPEERRRVEDFSRSLVTKLLHDPVIALKSEASDPEVLHVAERLFQPSR